MICTGGHLCKGSLSLTATSFANCSAGDPASGFGVCVVPYDWTSGSHRTDPRRPRLGQDGGAVYVRGSPHVSISDSSFENCSAIGVSTSWVEVYTVAAHW